MNRELREEDAAPRATFQVLAGLLVVLKPLLHDQFAAPFAILDAGTFAVVLHLGFLI
jgi:hypothetical protein